MEKDKYIDPDEKLKFKEIKIRITEEMYNEWNDWAEENDKSLDQYINCLLYTSPSPRDPH